MAMTRRLAQRIVQAITQRVTGGRRSPGAPVTLAQPTNLTVEEV